MLKRLYRDVPLKSGMIISLTEAQTHYLKHVLRLSEGKNIKIFNGHAGEWLATIEDMGRREVKARINSQLRPQEKESDIWLLFSPLKSGRTELVIEKATELGVSQIYPVVTRHCNTHRINQERMIAQACEAAEQSERLSIPCIHPLQPLTRLLDRWPHENPFGRTLIVCVERQKGPLLIDFLREQQISPSGPLAICIGPEGGFLENELNDLKRLPSCHFVSLGTYVLRAETAAIVALGGIILYRL